MLLVFRVLATAHAAESERYDDGTESRARRAALTPAVLAVDLFEDE